MSQPYALKTKRRVQSVNSPLMGVEAAVGWLHLLQIPGFREPYTPTGLQRTWRRSKVSSEAWNNHFYTLTLSHLHKVDGAGPQPSQPTGRLVSNVVHHLRDRNQGVRTEQLSSGGPTAVLNTSGHKLKQTQTVCRTKHAWTPHCLVAPDQHVYENTFL